MKFALNTFLSTLQKLLLLTIIIIYCLGCQTSSPEVVIPHIVPQPQLIQYNTEQHFTLNSQPALQVKTNLAEGALNYLNDHFKNNGWSCKVAKKGNADIVFSENNTLPQEAYELTVDNTGIHISASGPEGFFYGVQSLIQMLPTEKQIAVLPYLEIKDSPRFKWRGLHLDVGRHFYSVDFIKKYIDLMSLYKLNTFHWHLTEDQGWRIEIKKYPKLTEIGSQRKETIVEKNFNPYKGDGKPYGGFYTQEEVKEVVAYAMERQITVVPEIEMPGHSIAALAAYPELGCEPGPYEVGTKWGVYEEIYCPSEKTFAFLEDVLTEVMALFPSEYIHIGGDEAPKAAWKKSKLAQQVIKREGLKDEFELQSYFIQRIEKFLISKGRKLIGWDEILEGGLAPDAAVMSWRGEAGGIEAADAGHYVVMSPNADMYFDHYQADPKFEPLAIGGYTTLESVYHYEPIPEDLKEDAHKYVLGAQANVWTEYMKTSEHVEYMAYPRVVAMSEVLWTAPEHKDWNLFQKKMSNQYDLLGARNVNYHIAAPSGLTNGLTLEDTHQISLSSGFKNGAIHYTIDGSEPDKNSDSYQQPFDVDLSNGPVTIKAVVITKAGNSSAVSSATYQKVSLIEDIQPLKSDNGLTSIMHKGRFNSVSQLKGSKSENAGVVQQIGLPDNIPATFGMTFHGMINVPKDGVYTFYTRSDDGSSLTIHNQLVVDNDGPHGPQEVQGQIALKAGFHPIEVKYFEAGGGETLSVMIEGPGIEKQEVPASMLKH